MELTAVLCVRHLQRLGIFVAAFVLALSLGAIPAKAQSYSDSAYEEGPSEGRVTLLPEMNDGDTQALVARIQSGNRECASLRPEYRIDCLNRNYEWVAEEARKLGPDYAEAAEILEDLSQNLDRIVTENVDNEAPRARAPRPGKRKKNVEYRAVKTEKLAEANREAVQAIDNAVKKLQRSATGKRANHYQRIAQAVDSSKALLRSA